MESLAISLHQILVCNFAFNAGWFTTAQAASKTRVPARTVRRHLVRLVKLGILEKRTAFGGCRYHKRDESEMDDRAIAYVQRLTSIRETFERKPGKIRTTLASLAGLVLAI